MARTPTGQSDSRRISRQLEGGRRGGELTRATFAAALTRKRYAELVGINITTVRRWEMAGVVTPKQEVILGSPTYVFDRGDVDFGRRLIDLLRERPGELSVGAAAELVRSRSPGA
jgi:hypothetical protein